MIMRTMKENINVYQDFDNVEIKPNSEQSNSLYSSDIGPISVIRVSKTCKVLKT